MVLSQKLKKHPFLIIGFKTKVDNYITNNCLLFRIAERLDRRNSLEVNFDNSLVIVLTCF